MPIGRYWINMLLKTTQGEGDQSKELQPSAKYKFQSSRLIIDQIFQSIRTKYPQNIKIRLNNKHTFK